MSSDPEDDENAIQHSGLRIRLAETLISHGFRWVSDLDVLTDTQILALPGIGPTGLRQIRDEIDRLNQKHRPTLH